MKLAVFLAIGESLKDLEQKGQLKRLLAYNIKKFSGDFEQVYIFSYANEERKIYNNCRVIPNKYNLHRYLYSIALPLIHAKILSDCDIVRGLQLSGGIPAFFTKLLLGKKYVINYGYDYSSFANIEGKQVQSYLYKFIEKPILLLADAIIVTSKGIKKDLEKKNLKKLHFIPNGVDTKLFKPSSSKKNKLLSLLFIGRLEKQKNIIKLLEAVKLSNIKIKLRLFGEGKQKEEIIKIIKKLKLNALVNKPVDYSKVSQLLNRTDVFVLVSKEEGNPKILLEAMSCGKAVLGTNVGGIRELINDGKNGLLAETDEKSIEGKLRMLQDDNLRKKLGQNAREFILKNYEINNLLTKEVSLLLKLSK